MLTLLAMSRKQKRKTAGEEESRRGRKQERKKAERQKAGEEENRRGRKQRGRKQERKKSGEEESRRGRRQAVMATTGFLRAPHLHG